MAIKTKSHQKKKKQKEQIFRFLERGYFSFPLKDKGKRFEVLGTHTIYLKDKKLVEFLRQMKKHSISSIQVYEDAFWKAIKQEHLDKKFKNCWLVPMHIAELGNELMLDIDILKPVH